MEYYKTKTNIKEYLNKPFPFIENKNHRIILSIIFSLFIYLFLLTFQPFGISNIQFYKPIFILGFSSITFLILIISFLLAPLLFKNYFNLEKWTIKKNMMFIIVQIIIISFLNWLYNSTLGEDITVQHSLFTFIFITFAVGFFPTFFFIYFTEKSLADKNKLIASDFTNNIKNREISIQNNPIKLISKNNKETFTIDLDQLICIKSEGNYLKTFYNENNDIVQKIIRNSISKLESQFSEYNNIIRCHRSFIVNIDKVSKMSGNARNLTLHIHKLNFTIPVSRSFPKETFTNLKL